MPLFAPRFARGLAAAPPALFALALLACVNDESASPSLGLDLDAGLFAHSDTLRIVSNAAPSAASPGVLVRRSVSKGCEDGVMVSDTATDTTLYTVGQGVLHLWTEGDCLASRLTVEGTSGKGSSLTGTWTLDGQDSVPAAWRPAACDASELEYAVGPSGSYVFSKDRAIFRTNGAFCLARVFGENVARVLEGMEVSKGCDEVTLRVGAGEAVLSGEIAGNGVRLRLLREGETEVCEGILPLALRPPETCAASGAESDVPDAGLDALSACLADFYVDARESGTPAKNAPGQSREAGARIRASATSGFGAWPLSR